MRYGSPWIEWKPSKYALSPDYQYLYGAMLLTQSGFIYGTIFYKMNLDLVYNWRVFWNTEHSVGQIFLTTDGNYLLAALHDPFDGLIARIKASDGTIELTKSLSAFSITYAI